ncbi:hypothetical protein SLS60_011999 [Paraconiothyrium brasiliense]|uniref:Uncharacterized protein n=1 Tax=Paraconiothyrium brasiliense TaxID=300254 RepID=A0ABR3QGU6_9PLEO
MGGPVLPAHTQSEFPRAAGAASRLNPRAAPFTPGAAAHPPTAVSPSKSDFSSASTVLQATPPSHWHHFAPRVPVAGPYGAGILGHPGQQGHPHYESPLAGPSPGDLERAAAFAQYCATYFPDPHMQGWGPPVYAMAADHLAQHGGWNNGFPGAGKGKKKKGKKGKKGKGGQAAW